jgi:hypothetical protein
MLAIVHIEHMTTLSSPIMVPASSATRPIVKVLDLSAITDAAPSNGAAFFIGLKGTCDLGEEPLSRWRTAQQPAIRRCHRAKRKREKSN